MDQNNSTNSIMRSKIPKLRWGIQKIRAYCMEFCDNSNIHGLRYLSEQPLHWSERLVWLIAIGVSIGLCGTMTRNIWTRWKNDPTIITSIDKEATISSLPFPTLTFCTIKSPYRWSKEFSSDEIKRRNALAHIYPKSLVPPQFQDDFADESIYETLQTIHSKFWIGSQICAFFDINKCYVVFRPVLTDYGLCYTCNALNSRDIYTDQMAEGMMITNDNPNVTKFNLDTDLMRKYNSTLFPFQTSCVRCGEFKAMFKHFGPAETYNFVGFENGMYLMVTMPGESLATTRNMKRFLLGENVRIGVEPKMTTTSDALRSYDPQERQCYFDSERKLRFFRIYTQFNCEEECLANFTAIECGCVKFSMPRDRNTAICGAARIQCYKLAAQKFRVDPEAKSFREQCNCMPTCHYIEYSLTIDNFEWEGIVNLLYVSVFYEIRSEIVERLPSYTYSDFFGDCGGLLGLFMGISALSIIELIYYFTLRLFMTIRPTRNQMLEEAVASVRRRFVESKLSRWMPTKSLAHFFENSNIHGVLYFTRRGLHWIERLWWIIAFGLSIWLCSLLIGSVWFHWQDNPVVNSCNDVPISSVPFPTVTICPEIKFSTSKFDLNRYIFRRSIRVNYTALFADELALRSFEAVVYTNQNFGAILQKHPEKFSPNISEVIYETIQDIAPKLSEVVKECRWQERLVNCSEYLVPVLTEDGLCFAFNALNSHEMYTEQMSAGMKIVTGNPNVSGWTIENGYDTESIEAPYPFPLLGSFEIILIRFENDYLDIYKAAKMYFNGFKVALTMPGEELDLRNNYFQVQVSEAAQITLNPKVTTISDGLRRYDPMKRRCFLQSERQLAFFKTYTKHNCEIECLANDTQDYCGCVTFSKPKNSSQNICGLGKYICSDVMDFDMKYVRAGTGKFDLDSCNCLPACHNVDYNTVTDRGRFRNIRSRSSPSIGSNVSNVKFAKLSISFENEQIEAINQVETYTVADFLSICGGLLGLFMGASVLSFIEIIYFFTLRVFWSVRRERADNEVIILN